MEPNRGPSRVLLSLMIFSSLRNSLLNQKFPLLLLYFSLLDSTAIHIWWNSELNKWPLNGILLGFSSYCILVQPHVVQMCNASIHFYSLSHLKKWLHRPETSFSRGGKIIAILYILQPALQNLIMELRFCLLFNDIELLRAL